MRLLIIHPEARYLAGAEKMLGYYLNGLTETGHSIVLAVSGDVERLGSIPKSVQVVRVPDTGEFSARRLTRQVALLADRHRHTPFDLVHAWAARDWELASLLRFRIGGPVIGTLHDHPRASFISRKRQLMMWWCGRLGLQRIVCVSHAVSRACVAARYLEKKLCVVHNGLPPGAHSARAKFGNGFRIGFLGAFSERKGLRDLFAILAEVSRLGDAAWEIHVAGAAQDVASEKLVAVIREQYSNAPWWQRVHWNGWLTQTDEWLSGLDLLVVPSSEFDPFPTVLLEAARAGVPALAAKVGGVPEIVVEGETGWLFEPGRPQIAAQILRRAFEHPDECRQCGKRARARAVSQFSVGKMVAEYVNLYSTLLPDV